MQIEIENEVDIRAMNSKKKVNYRNKFCIR